MFSCEPPLPTDALVIVVEIVWEWFGSVTVCVCSGSDMVRVVEDVVPSLT